VVLVVDHLSRCHADLKQQPAVTVLLALQKRLCPPASNEVWNDGRGSCHVDTGIGFTCAMVLRLFYA
jgi:hypothetical protein